MLHAQLTLLALFAAAPLVHDPLQDPAQDPAQDPEGRDLPEWGYPEDEDPQAEAGPERPLARPDAGQDLELVLGETADLVGRIENHSPLDFWVADGNDRYENMLLHFHDGGMTAVGPMRRPTGQVMGWTGDLVRIGDRVYGIDVGARHVYVADLESGMCLPITPQLSEAWRGLQGLAYDAEDDHLYAVDQGSGALVEITRGTGHVRRIDSRELAGRKGVRSLAFEPDVRLLFAADSDADLLLVIDPETGWLADTMSLPSDQVGHIEELTFFEGELYAMVALPDAAGAFTRGQLQRIDLRTGFVSSVGEPIADVSPHALLIESVPEQFYWAQVAGPAVASLDYTTLLETSASFPQPGCYEFALTVLTREGPVVDRVAVTVLEPAQE